MFFKLLSQKLRLEFFGTAKLIDSNNKIQIFVSSFKIAGINLTGPVSKLAMKVLKKYDSKHLKVKYPYIIVDLEYLRTSED